MRTSHNEYQEVSWSVVCAGRIYHSVDPAAKSRGRALEGEAEWMPMTGAAKRKQGYVDCQTGSQSTLYVYRPCGAHSPVEPGCNSPHAHGHLSQYQYPSDLCRVDLHRAQSRRYRNAFDNALREGSDNTRR